MKESIKDWIVNNIFAIRIRFCRGFGKEEPSGSLSFYDGFNSLNNWRIGQPWGRFHPDYPYQFYSDDAVSTNGKLILKQFPSGDKLSFPQYVGLLSSKQSFGYGYFRMRIKLPKGVGLWPAVWLSAEDSWPPEIDLIEGYSDRKGDWGSRLQSNFHWNLEKCKESSGARNHPVDTESDITVGCLFQKDCIKIYYNGWLVRQITSEHTMKWYRNKKMLVILNNAIRPDFVNMVSNQKSEFIVYDFSFFDV